ncbi:ATP-dependent protease La [Halteromyces radiatus]|uniref:ATP-dependent protease La n=1 Tax=Halteromyces radiatus TaxID=101107 RepID=UPI0022209D90|nr:ATP-dependent protease La [Halteromyces radiatus]KAI8078735.1 ATP-dependent protease La [Halteromyces radiatus]
MSHSFLVHVSKTISRSKFNQTLATQFQTPTQQAKRTITSTSTRAAPGVSLWGGDVLRQSLQSSPSNSVLVMLQPLRTAASVKRQFFRSASTQAGLQLRERDPNDDPVDHGDGRHGNNGHGDGNEHGSGGGRDGKPPRHDDSTVIDNQLQKPSVPDVYPQVLALPIARRPLFPGFYKAVVVKDPNVTAAIKELLKRGQPYVGAFLLKDEDLDVDTITSMDQVHRVGVFAQITSVFPASAGKDGKEEDAGLTAVLYPHRRIKMKELLPLSTSSQQQRHPTTAKIELEEDALVHDHDSKKSIESKHDVKRENVVPGEELMSDTLGDKVAKEELESSTLEKENIKENTQQYATSFLTRDYHVSLANVENLEDLPYSKKSPLVRAVTSEIVSVFKDIASLNPLFRDQIASFSMSQSAGNVFEEPAKLADFAAAVSAGEPMELQEVLETLAVDDRLQKSLLVLKKELMNAQLQNKISKEVESKIAKRQREYYLMEQLKGIKKELGLESDGKDKLVEGFKEKAGKLAMPQGVKKVFDEEINKLAHLEPAASEFNVTRNYLDWLTQVPWGQRSRENYNMHHAKTVLDEDHYGLKDVKDRIMEFIAVSKLRGSVEGKILCLSGPPGVGKTSIGKSIARALDREFYRFSVGGLTDVAEIKGHRRTYVGAMPGKVIQALKKVQTENPLILIDEIDKVGRGHQGDPSSALLELLDPEQNASFLDHYMDVPIDLSKVLFVCTANVLDTIPGPLLDRMEVIQLSGYVAEEKAAIAEKYLAPAAKKSSGLEHVNVNLTSAAVDTLIKNYCRESGVRNLKKQIDKVFRKAALNVVEQVGDEEIDQTKADAHQPEELDNVEQQPKDERKPLEIPGNININIDSDNLRDYVGPAVFQSDRLYEKTPPGVIMGLAWTSMGGSSLYIESVLESSLTPKSTPGLSKTGQLGDVMKESTSIAYTFAKSLMATHYPNNKFFEKAKLHLHCPAGAVPKDGPSAGITMATSLISLALNQPVKPNIAMTGELTVTGKVLQIGGLKEKTIAAKRSKVDTILFPKDNKADWEDLPDHIKEGMTGIPVDTYDDVFKVCFDSISKEQAENVWKDILKDDEDSKEKSTTNKD